MQEDSVSPRESIFRVEFAARSPPTSTGVILGRYPPPRSFPHLAFLYRSPLVVLFVLPVALSLTLTLSLSLLRLYPLLPRHLGLPPRC